MVAMLVQSLWRIVWRCRFITWSSCPTPEYILQGNEFSTSKWPTYTTAWFITVKTLISNLMSFYGWIESDTHIQKGLLFNTKEWYSVFCMKIYGVVHYIKQSKLETERQIPHAIFQMCISKGGSECVTVITRTYGGWEEEGWVEVG